MIHVDLDYALYVAGAVFFAIRGCWFFFDCGIGAKRTDGASYRVTAGVLGATFILMALASMFSAGETSGSVYHPCVVESFETMKMKCR